MRTGRAVAPPIGFVLVTLAGLLAAPHARAEERKGSFESGFLFGPVFYANELEIKNGEHYGFRFGWNVRPAYEVELQYLKTGDSKVTGDASTLIADPTVLPSNPGLTFSTSSYHARFLINPTNIRRRFKPYFLTGLGIQEFSSDPKLSSSEEGETQAKVVTLGGGIRMRLTPHMAFRAEFETEYAVSEVYHNEHLNVGLTWVFGAGRPADTDGDGVFDLSDLCPDTPKGALIDQHTGCPWDLDSDGVMEGIDKCAETPRGWPVNEAGCPKDSDADSVPDGADKCAETPQGAIVRTDGCPLDSDGDTILDGIDRCPDTPKGALVDPADSPTAGCPHDTDQDGVVDGVDQCQPTPHGATVDDKGCPQDSDGDRVLDGLDPCPDTPKGAKIDKEGCPRVRLDKAEPQILHNVKFVRGIELWPGTEAWLQLLIDALNYWTDVTVEIGIYTDSTGSAQANRNIALRRAEVIKEWLVQHGVEPRRLVIKGYGAVNFIADNETEEGREKNRRVEVKRLFGDLRKHPKPEAEPVPAPDETAPAPPEPAPDSPAPEEPKQPPESAPPAEEPKPSPEEPAPPEPAPEPAPGWAAPA